MSVVELVKASCREQMSRIAKTIEGELKGECPVRSGEAQASIGIEQISDTKYRIGGNNLHLKYADQGNGGKGTIIKSTRKFDRRGRRPGKLQFSDGTYANWVFGYEGKHFVRKVADRHR